MTSEHDSAAVRAEVDGYCAEANREGAAEDVLSPSGRFRLIVRNYRSRPGAWNVSRGVVTRVSDGAVVADLCRNISGFGHTFVQKDGAEWLIAGRAYTSQTLVNLDTGAEYEPPGDPYLGEGFCWTDVRLSPDGNTLLVEGCVWACPYEVRFFDFTNPARGWPELTLDGIPALAESSNVAAPRWRDDGTAEVHLADHQKEPHERVVLERRGDRMVVRTHDVSDAERARRAAALRHAADVRAWWKTFHTTDPRYLRLVALVEQHRIPNDTLDWQPGGRSLCEHFRRAEPGASADLNWNLDEETLFVQLYGPTGERAERTQFPSTLEGIEAAMAKVAHAFAVPSD